MQRGFPVAGSVITAIAFEQFIAAIDWQELPFADFPSDWSDAKPLQAIARQIRDRIEATPLVADWLTQDWQAPALLLRPQVLDSAAAANDWLRPQICWAEPNAIATALKRVWGEVFRAKSLLFWQRSHLSLGEIRLAVLVQPISAAIASGRVRLSETEKLLQGQPGLAGLSGLTDSISIDLLNEKSIASLHHLQLSAGHDRSPDCLVYTPTSTAQPILNSSQVQQLMQLAQAIAVESGVELEWLLTEQFWITQVRSLKVAGTNSLSVNQFDLKRPASNDSNVVRGLAASGGQAIGTAWVLKDNSLPAHLPVDAIVVADRLAISLLHQFSIQGFAIEQGSMTSHCAILARELNLPAIVGAIDATQKIQTGDRVCLDGDRGLLYRVTADQRLTTKPAAPVSALTLSDSQPQLMVNLSQVATLETIRQVAIAGIGLLRADLLLLDLLHTPTQATIAAIADRIRPFAQAIYPRPVYYRSIDRSPSESSRSLLGLHGTASYQLATSWFERELLALRQLQQEGFDNLHLLLPFVRTVEEFVRCRFQVERSGLMQPNFRLWIMAEVPSVLFLLPDYVQAGVQGIAIGSNDLTQLLLGIDRDEPQFAHYSAMHPAVLQAMQQLIQTAHQLNIPCSICGQAASQPELITLLVQWGITTISVEPQAIEIAAQAIAASNSNFNHRSV